VKPYTLWINVTGKCNLRCKHCFRDSGNVWKSELTTQEIFSVIDQFASMGGKDLIISGGEPFLRDDIFEILEFAKKKVPLVQIITNGTCITKEMANRLKKLEPLYLQISIDGASDEVNDFIRGAGSFQRAVQGLRNLKDSGFEKRDVWR